MRCPLGLVAAAVLAIVRPAGAGEISGIACVHDGDTLRVEARRRGAWCLGGTPVRLKGVVAPELDEPGGLAARDALVRLAEGRVVVCALTGELGDRQIGWCRVSPAEPVLGPAGAGPGGGVLKESEVLDLGAQLVRAGVARDCPRWSRGAYAELEQAAAAEGATIGRSYLLPGWCLRH